MGPVCESIGLCRSGGLRRVGQPRTTAYFDSRYFGIPLDRRHRTRSWHDLQRFPCIADSLASLQFFLNACRQPRCTGFVVRLRPVTWGRSVAALGTALAVACNNPSSVSAAIRRPRISWISAVRAQRHARRLNTTLSSLRHAASNSCAPAKQGIRIRIPRAAASGRLSSEA
jgi:hypothetical protein